MVSLAKTSYPILGQDVIPGKLVADGNEAVDSKGLIVSRRSSTATGLPSGLVTTGPVTMPPVLAQRLDKSQNEALALFSRGCGGGSGVIDVPTALCRGAGKVAAALVLERMGCTDGRALGLSDPSQFRALLQVAELWDPARGPRIRSTRDDEKGFLALLGPLERAGVKLRRALFGPRAEDGNLSACEVAAIKRWCNGTCSKGSFQELNRALGTCDPDQLAKQLPFARVLASAINKLIASATPSHIVRALVDAPLYRVQSVPGVLGDTKPTKTSLPMADDPGVFLSFFTTSEDFFERGHGFLRSSTAVVKLQGGVAARLTESPEHEGLLPPWTHLEYTDRHTETTAFYNRYTQDIFAPHELTWVSASATES